MALPRVWHAFTEEDPPMDPASADTAWSEALAWAVATGVVSAVTGLFARRAASEYLVGTKPSDAYD